MRSIRRRNYIFAAATGLGVVVCVLLIVIGAHTSGILAQMLLVIMLLSSAVAAVLWIRECGRLNIARLIAENSILHIRAVVICNVSDETRETKETKYTEVSVSYFGILLDVKIIRFNQDGIRLKAVELGPNYILLTYGTERRMQSIRLIRPAVSREELDGVAEKFRYETGVVSIIKM